MKDYDVISNVQRLAEIDREMKALKAEQDFIKEQLLDYMEKSEQPKLDTDIASITYIPESTKESLDIKALREYAPQIYDNFARITSTKPYVKVNIKRERKKS